MTRSKLNKKQLKEKVVGFLSSRPRETFTLKQLFNSLRLTTHPLKILCVDVLNELIDEEQIFRNYDGEIGFNGKTNQVTEGVFRCLGKRRNLVETSEGLSIFINDDDTLHALNGDKVKVTIFATRKKSDRLYGEIIEIIERSNKPIVGVLQINHGVAFLIHPDGSLPYDVFIPESQLKGGKNGDKALVQIIDWPDNTRNPIGVVKEIFGKEGENETEMHAILAEYGLPYSYPKEVERYADKISDVIPAEEYAKREDFRNVTTFTIDPRDAKDFDDALSIRPLEKGHYEVGVHIADVSHYVLEGSIIDNEAHLYISSTVLFRCFLNDFAIIYAHFVLMRRN